MKAIRVQENGTINLSDVPLPVLESAAVMVSVEACGLCTTDLEILSGRFWGSYPITPGHEICGLVEEVGDEVSRILVGDRVVVDPNIPCHGCDQCMTGSPHLCMNLRAIGVTEPGGFAEFVVVPVANVYPLSFDVSPAIGALAEPLACVLHGIDRGAITKRDRVAIHGSGFIGLMFSIVLNHLGVSDVVLIDPASPRRMIAEQLGFDLVLTPDGAREYFRNVADRDRPSVSIDCSGNPLAIRSAIETTRPGGRVLLFGVADPEAQIPVSPYDVFRRELTILGSFVNPFTQERAVKMLSVMDLNLLITHRYGLREFEEAVATRNLDPEALKVIIEPRRSV